MKKFFALIAVCTLFYANETAAQKKENADPAVMLQEMKERIKPQLMDQAKITDAQAERVIMINTRIQAKKRDIRMDQTLSDADKKIRYAELDAERDKEYAGGVQLTEEQIKNVNAFFTDMKKQAKPKATN